MGQAKEFMMKNEEDMDLLEFLKELHDSDELSKNVSGITKQITVKGVDSMSVKQKYVIDEFVKEYKLNHDCEMCAGDNISSLSDYIYVANNGICPSCQNRKEKYMKD